MFSKVYIVDDDEVSSFLTAILLETLEFARQVQTYIQAEEALEALSQEPATEQPDIIFLDLHMPEITGWDFLDRLKEQQQSCAEKCTVYILTSSVDEEEKLKSANYPMVAAFLHKPLEEEQLKHILASRL